MTYARAANPHYEALAAALNEALADATDVDLTDAEADHLPDVLTAGETAVAA